MSETDCVIIHDPGLLSTLQDEGRRGVGAWGVAPSGAADWLSARVANQLVGNPPGAVLIETTLNGVSFSATRALTVAVTGANTTVAVSGSRAGAWASIPLQPQDRVDIRTGARGVRNYIAFAGGIVAPLVLGSASTDVTAGLGGLHGRALKSGDGLRIALREDLQPRSRHLPAEARPVWREQAVLRVLTGPQAHNLADADLPATFTVTPQCNRQGIRLAGNAVRGRQGWDVLSFGVTTGCVQIANDGQPIILLTDRQTTGGYGVPWVVITADIPLAAQLRPGDTVTFQAVNQSEAAKAWHERTHCVSNIRSH